LLVEQGGRKARSKHSPCRTSLSIEESERVEGIELIIKAGSFIGFDPLPLGWYLIIDNDPSQQTSIKGDARVGTAALEIDSLLRLRIRIRKIEFADRTFSISGTLIATRNFESERRIVLGRENFRLVNTRPK
jgi:hypothetical protein